MKTPSLSQRLAPCLLVLLLLAPTAPAYSEGQGLESRIKAAFLFNFARFITWPETKWSASSEPLRIGILEPDTLGPVLDETVRGKQVDGRAIEIRRSSRIADLADCHVVYIDTQDRLYQQAALTALAGKSVMTVYEGDITETQGIARFYLDARNVRFEINRAAAEREGLQISARLLGVASVVNQ